MWGKPQGKETAQDSLGFFQATLFNALVDPPLNALLKALLNTLRNAPCHTLCDTLLEPLLQNHLVEA